MISDFLKSAQPLTIGFFLIVISMAKFGISTFHQAGIFFNFSIYWKNPGSAPLLVRGVMGNDYLLTNSWSALFSGMLGISDPVGFYIFQLGLTIIALLIPFAMPSLTSSPVRLRLLVALVLAGPQCVVLLNWVGGYDALSMIGAVLAVSARSSPLSMLGWGLLALNHPSLAFTAWLLWMPMRMWFNRGLVPRQRLMGLIFSLAPITIGILINHIIVASWGGNTSRIDWLVNLDYHLYFKNYTQALPAIIWSLLGLGWVILIGTSLFKTFETRLLLLIITLAAVLLPLIALDETRVASLALLPVLLTYVRYTKIPKDDWLLGSGFKWFFMGAILTPTVLVFGRSMSIHGWTWVWRLFESISLFLGLT